MKYNIGLILLLVSFTVCRAQTKNSFTITDEQGNAIARATIHILNTDIFLLSDEAGRFSIPALPKGTYKIEISAIGFARIEKEVQLPLTGDQQRIPLATSARQLDAVVVTAEKKEANIQNVRLALDLVNMVKVTFE